jgi:hypothetical protein
LWLIVYPLARALPPLSAGPARGTRWRTGVLAGLAGLALLGGLHVQLEAASRREWCTQSRADAEQVLALYDEILTRSRQMGLERPVLSQDFIGDFLTHLSAGVLEFERSGTFREFGQALGASIFAVDEKAALAHLERSHFVVLTDGPFCTPPVYPFYQSIEALRPRLRAYCEKELVRIRTVHLLGRTLDLYARPVVHLTGDSHGWITSEGLTLSGPCALLKHRPRVRLRGEARLDLLGRVPPVEVEVRRADQSVVVPATFSMTGTEYRLEFSLPPACLEQGPNPMLVVEVRFGAYFIPRKLGLNEDERKLVVYTPREVTLSPRAP